MSASRQDKPHFNALFFAAFVRLPVDAQTHIFSFLDRDDSASLGPINKEIQRSLRPTLISFSYKLLPNPTFYLFESAEEEKAQLRKRQNVYKARINQTIEACPPILVETFNLRRGDDINYVRDTALYFLSCNSCQSFSNSYQEKWSRVGDDGLGLMFCGSASFAGGVTGICCAMPYSDAVFGLAIGAGCGSCLAGCCICMLCNYLVGSARDTCDTFGEVKVTKKRLNKLLFFCDEYKQLAEIEKNIPQRSEEKSLTLK